MNIYVVLNLFVNIFSNNSVYVNFEKWIPTMFLVQIFYLDNIQYSPTLTAKMTWLLSERCVTRLHYKVEMADCLAS